MGSFPLLSFLFAGGVVGWPAVMIPMAFAVAGVAGPLAMFFLVVGIFLPVFCVLAGIVCAFIGLHTGKRGPAAVALLVHVWIGLAMVAIVMFWRR